MKVTAGRLRLSASDAANFLACQHLTRLDLLRARGRLSPPRGRDLGFEDLASRGEAHERAVLAEFRGDGLRITEIGAAPEADAASATLAAMRDGAEVIYQGVLLHEPPAGGPVLVGRPDFLVRAGLLPVPGGGSRGADAAYEVVDAKLARSAKARAVAQAAFYSHLLAGLQDSGPHWMHLALGNGERTALKVGDYAAYEREVRRFLAEFIAGDRGENPPSDPYPDPVEHCAVCRWRDFCDARRRRDDDLCLIAGMTKGQRQALKAAGVPTRRGFAGLATLPAVGRAAGESLQRAQLQARLQAAVHRIIRLKVELGLIALP